MSVIRTVVVAMDFSPASNDALGWAAAFAAEQHARLVVIHVCELPWADDPAYTPPAGSIEALVASAARRLERCLSPVRTRCTATALVRAGDPCEAILACASEMQADLIIMGTHGWHGATRDRLGRVARDVVHQASCPVLTLRGSSREPVTTAQEALTV